ncbi:hypothetical protein LDENG_00095760 [Lucifuga dentata]|nr:hypothetical protein LDENG_00095760 [Lucifuga dentata]
MKLNVCVWVVVLLGVFLTCSVDCRPVDGSTALSTGHRLLPQALLLQLVDEFSLQLDGVSSVANSSSSSSSSASSSAMRQALLLLKHRLLQDQQEKAKAREKDKRSDESPISLDLTFHLLREVLEMVRVEQIAEQANSNRRIMDNFGK